MLILLTASSSEINSSGCKYVPMVKKHENREIIELHFKHKKDKLRKRLLEQGEQNKKLALENEKLEAENRENFVFRLADKSFPSSECESNEHFKVKELQPAYEKFDYPVNESELHSFKRQLNEKPLELIKSDKLLQTPQNNLNDDDLDIGIPCGQKIGNLVLLRSFHDRICDEPRGEKSCHQFKVFEKSTCLTHKQWLDVTANDPEILVKFLRRKKFN